VTSLVLAGLLFITIHLLVSGTTLRGAIVRRTGEGPFRGLFSVLSLGSIIWLCMAYGRASHVQLWQPIEAARLAMAPVMGFAFLLAAIGLTTPSPTAAGGDTRLHQPDPVTGILRITRHPFLWGVTLWAVMHLLVNGDAASTVLFGTFLIVALLGPPSIDAKRKKRFGVAWDRFAEASSNLPFAAIAQGRNTLRVRELGWWRVALGLVLFAAFLYFHAQLFGVPAV
jgi:uncharacterized membrane protein